MNVVQLGPYSGPHGGVQANLTAIYRVLLGRGISCSVINLTRLRCRNADGVYYPKNALQLLWLLATRRFDVMHLHLGGILDHRELALAAVCSCIPHCKHVLTFHSGGYPGSEQGKRAHRRTLRGAIFRRFDAIVAVNEAIRDLFQDFGVAPERIHVIPPHAILAPPQQHTAFPEALERFFSRHQPTLLTVGLLEPEYDLFLQLDVLPLVRQVFPRAGLAIIGEGSLHRELARRIERHPCADDILLCGDVPHNATLQAISRADVLLRTTLYDGDSISVREALHFGTPVIATENGMRPNGVYLIPVSDVYRLKAAIEYVAALPIVRSTCDAPDERNIDMVLALYRSLVSPGRNGEGSRANVASRS